MHGEAIMIIEWLWHLPSYIINFVTSSQAPLHLYLTESLVVQQEAQDNIYGIVFKAL